MWQWPHGCLFQAGSAGLSRCSHAAAAHKSSMSSVLIAPPAALAAAPARCVPRATARRRTGSRRGSPTLALLPGGASTGPRRRTAAARRAREERRARGDVEARRRLVAHEHSAPRGERHRGEELLLHAARQIAEALAPARVRREAEPPRASVGLDPRTECPAQRRVRAHHLGHRRVDRRRDLRNVRDRARARSPARARRRCRGCAIFPRPARGRGARAAAWSCPIRSGRRTRRSRPCDDERHAVERDDRTERLSDCSKRRSWEPSSGAPASGAGSRRRASCWRRPAPRARPRRAARHRGRSVEELRAGVRLGELARQGSHLVRDVARRRRRRVVAFVVAEVIAAHVDAERVCAAVDLGHGRFAEIVAVKASPFLRAVHAQRDVVQREHVAFQTWPARPRACAACCRGRCRSCSRRASCSSPRSRRCP